MARYKEKINCNAEGEEFLAAFPAIEWTVALV